MTRYDKLAVLICLPFRISITGEIFRDKNARICYSGVKGYSVRVMIGVKVCILNEAAIFCHF